MCATTDEEFASRVAALKEPTQVIPDGVPVIPIYPTYSIQVSSLEVLGLPPTSDEAFWQKFDTITGVDWGFGSALQVIISKGQFLDAIHQLESEYPLSKVKSLVVSLPSHVNIDLEN